ncbi:MAG: tetratricopeptide repeat protein [Terriglobales bacterium]
MGDSSARQISNHRVDSWKEIAAFLGRDERTVRRWEKERSLPIHRLPGGGRGGVFAYTSELREWLKGRGSEFEPAEVETLRPSARTDEMNAASLSQPIIRPTSRPTSGPTIRPAKICAVGEIPGQLSVPRRSWLRTAAWLAPLAIVAATVFVFSFAHREPSYKNALAAPHTPNPEAQELYLKGQYHWAKRTPEDLNKAVDYFTQSIVKDPSYAPAYVGLADCYNLLREFSIMPPDEAYPRALAAAQKAVELDDTSPGAHNSLAFATYYWNWDPVAAEREFQRALALDPNFVQAHHWYATFLLTSARFPEALDQIEQARQLDPSSTAIQADKARILYDAGRKSEALALLRQLESTDPSLASTHAYLAAIYLDRKDYQNFFAESKQAAQLRHDEAALVVAKAAEQGFAVGGPDGMRKRMAPVQKEMFNRDLGSAYNLAATYALLGEKEQALRYLQAAYDKRDVGLLYLSRNPEFASLHDDPLYQELTRRVKEKLSQPLPQSQP